MDSKLAAPRPVQTQSRRRAELVRERRVEEVAVLRASPAGKLLFCPVTQLDISASRIRGLLAEGRSPRYLLPGAVLEYIQVAGLYQQ